MTRRRLVRRDRLRKNPKLSWDTYQRQVLCCLYRFFECRSDQLSAIFSNIFWSQLRQRGYGSADVPYRTLDTQWTWLRRQKRPVWHHVHVATEFRKDGDWKEIIHLIRRTAFELGILLNEKLNDTIVIRAGNCNANKDPSEFLTSVLLNNPSTPQRRSSIADSVNAPAHPSVEQNRDLEGHFSGHGHPDSSAPSAALIDGFSSSASPSTFPYNPETASPGFDRIILMSSREFGSSEDDGLLTPSPQGPALVDYHRANTQRSDDSSQAFESLVTGNNKICYWCDREGTSLVGTPPAEPHLDFRESREYHTHGSNNASPSESCRPDMHQIASVDTHIQGSSHLPQCGELPGLCGVGDIPPLLYRWSNGNSQGINTESVLVAGWFTTDYPHVGSPTQLSESDFLNVFAAHVTRVQVPTPFISAFSRPLAPCHRALRNRENARISVIDSRRIPTPVFHAQPLAQVTQTTVKRWKGYGEYAIWGYVPSEAIVCTIEITALEDITSWDHEIQQFLQLDLIQEQETCHRALRRKLRANLQNCSYKSCCSMLRRLAFYLGVPEEYQEHFAKGIHEAWSMDFGPAYLDRVELYDPETPPAPALAPVPAVLAQVHYLNEASQRVSRCNSESTASYAPPKSDDGSCSESTSGEEDNLSQSPEAPCPRRDTPSPAFSVVSDSDDSSVHVNIHRSRPRVVEISEVAIPPTPPSTSRYFGRAGNINSTVSPLNLSRLNLSSSLNDDQYLSEGAEWPSDSDKLPGIEIPTQSRFFEQRDNDGASGRPAVSDFTMQGRNPFALSNDDMVEL